MTSGRVMLTDGWATVAPDGAREWRARPWERLGFCGYVLVLTRKTNQSIMIGDAVEVAVLAVSRDKIRLGITAPRDVPVFRKEVYLSIQEEQVAAEGPAAKQVDEALDDLSSETPRAGA
jgi:carbon storage regulator